MIAVAVSSFIVGPMWTMEQFRTTHYLSGFSLEQYTNESADFISSKLNRFIFSDPTVSLFVLDLICLVIFTLELALHFCMCYDKWKYFQRTLNVISLFVIIVMWIPFTLEFFKFAMLHSTSLQYLYFICKAMTISRMFLFFRLEKTSGALSVLTLSIRSSLGDLLLLGILLVIATVVFANLIYYAEVGSNETSGIHSIFIAMWWAIITMSTIGYGDYYPTSTTGYIVGVICAVCGLVLIALPIAIIAGNFADYDVRNKDIKRAIKLKHLRNTQGVKSRMRSILGIDEKDGATELGNSLNGPSHKEK